MHGHSRVTIDPCIIAYDSGASGARRVSTRSRRVGGEGRGKGAGLLRFLPLGWAGLAGCIMAFPNPVLPKCVYSWGHQGRMQGYTGGVCIGVGVMAADFPSILFPAGVRTH